MVTSSVWFTFPYGLHCNFLFEKNIPSQIPYTENKKVSSKNIPCSDSFLFYGIKPINQLKFILKA